MYELTLLPRMPDGKGQFKYFKSIYLFPFLGETATQCDGQPMGHTLVSKMVLMQAEHERRDCPS